jgi:cyclopropane fatty-acyl-phospholipid synthase-like methyltransferase
VLDIGRATGGYAVMAAKLGSKVISLDVDDGIINHVYKQASATNLPITPVVKDLFAEEYVNGRYRGEMVLALDIVDHLALTQGYSFDQIARTLSNYTEKWLATEFIDRRDLFAKEYLQNNGGSYQGDTSWFKCENFISSLSRYFLIKQKFKSSSENSSLLLVEKI